MNTKSSDEVLTEEDQLEESGATDIDKQTDEKPVSIPLDTFQKITYYTNQFSINNIVYMINDGDLDL
jgi:hypothetical protein